MSADAEPRYLTARYRGTCAQCAGPILPGDPIAQHAPRVTTHAEGCAADLAAAGPDHVAMLARPTGRGRRSRRPARVSYRCTHEDYPCCGCGADGGRGYWTGEY